jgi:hypothetical protein
MADIDVWGSLAAGAAAGQKYKETLAQPEILKQAYAGVTPEEIAKDPAKQQSVYAQAAVMAGQKGMNQLSYTFQKQASELSSEAQTKQLNDLKIKEAQATYANQLLTSAQSDQDLESIVDKTVTDPAALMQVKSILKREDFDFNKKKQILVGMTETAQNRIAAQNALIMGQLREAQIKNITEDNARADKNQAFLREKEETRSKEFEAREERKSKEFEERESRREKESRVREQQGWARIQAMQDKATQATVKSSREARYADTVAIAGNEAATSIGNIVSLPITVSAGPFAGKSKTTLFNAPIEALKNAATPEDVQRYNTEIDNVGKYYSTMLSGGLQTSKGAADQFSEQFRIKEGDKLYTKLTKLAQMRQTFDRAAEIKINSKATPPEQVDLWKEWRAQVAKDIPITVADINKISNEQKAGKGKKLISEVLGMKAEQVNKSKGGNTAADEAKAAGF